MTLFAVNREAGPGWLEDAGAFDQPDVNAHAAFMEGLAMDGVLLAAGPLADTASGRIRVLLIAEASNEAEIVDRLAADPWELTGRIKTATIEPWTVVAGSIASRAPEQQT